MKRTSEEFRAKNAAYMRARYWADVEKSRAYSRLQNLVSNVNPHRPEGPQKETLRRCRVKCLQMGGDPGSTHDMKLAMLEVGYESPELQRSIFHPDYICRQAGQWSDAWRRVSKKYREALIKEVKSTQVNCVEFEPLQPEND